MIEAIGALIVALIVLAAPIVFRQVRARREQYRREIAYAEKVRERVDDVIRQYEAALPKKTNRFLTSAQAHELVGDLHSAAKSIKKVRRKVRRSIQPRMGARELDQLIAGHRERVSSENQAFCARQLEQHRELFDTLESFPLSEEQRSAIVHDDQYSLVVAGAGTGKTSTILGKVAWLIGAEQAMASEILVLAFNKAAAEEVAERLEQAGYHGMQVRTFHSLGLKIHRESAPDSLHISKLVEQGMATLFIESAIQKIAAGNRSHLLERFIALYRTPLFDETDPVNRERFMATRLMTLKGERVRSEQERRIADWCTLHGVEYVYEKAYTWPGEEVSRYSYRPDFYFPEIDAWLEHWGVSREGKTRPGISRKAYQQQKEKKERVHQENGTILLSTHSYEFFEGRWEEVLRKQLVDHGLHPSLQTEGDWMSPEERVQQISSLARLISRFLALFRPSFPLGSKPSLVLRVPGFDSKRASTFLSLFDEVMRLYEEELTNEGAIDFAEMIHSAYLQVEAGDWPGSFKYVIVDEFQDMSHDRARLVRALMKTDDEVRFLGVGDDWQSINRFAGADVTLMTEFEQHFGHSVRKDLTQTYRYPEQILRASEKFITRNPLQLQKSLSAGFCALNTCIRIVPDDRASVIRAILEMDPGEDPVDVLWLTRYRDMKPGAEGTANRHPKVRSYREETIHASKGEEADYVVVSGLTSSGLSFPSTIEDDPLLDLLQPDQEGFPFGEERRLMYVAMTRAKKGLILLHPVGSPRSPFLAELMSEDYADYLQVGTDLIAEAHSRCPVCEVGQLQQKSGADGGHFWACGNFPQCSYKPVECPNCRDAFLSPTDSGNKLECVDARCSGELPACPSCGLGGLVPRMAGSFLGCTRFPDCDYTRNTGRSRRR